MYSATQTFSGLEINFNPGIGFLLQADPAGLCLLGSTLWVWARQASFVVHGAPPSWRDAPPSHCFVGRIAKLFPVVQSFFCPLSLLSLPGLLVHMFLACHDKHV